MAEFKINLNDMHSYEWSDLYWFDFEVAIGFWALSSLVNNQEEIYHNKKKEFIENKEIRLADIPDEFKGSYEQQFFEDGDRTFEQLIEIQRYSVCLSFFSYLEGKLVELLKMMINEFKIDLEIPTTKVIPSIDRLIEIDFGVNNESYIKDFSRIKNQLVIRNSIAHNQSYLKNKNQFPKTDGLELKGLKVVISKTSYLETMISQAERSFKNLLIAVDKRLTKINSK